MVNPMSMSVHQLSKYLSQLIISDEQLWNINHYGLPILNTCKQSTISSMLCPLNTDRAPFLIKDAIERWLLVRA